MHGQYISSVDRELVSEGATFLRLSRWDVRGETESEIIAAQDQALRTKYYTNNIYIYIYYRQKQRANTDYVNKLMRQ